jgi:ribosomal protein L28
MRVSARGIRTISKKGIEAGGAKCGRGARKHKRKSCCASPAGV